MSGSNPPQWLTWARRIQAIAQSGKTYSENEFQTERYEQLEEIAAEIISQHSMFSEDELLQSFDEQLGYATPKVDVRAAVFDEHGRLLMVQDWRDSTWSMPGGWADVGDVPSEAAERETWEEAGFEVKARRVIGVYDANRVPGYLTLYHAFKLVFLCDLIGGEARTSNETLDVRFFAVDDIPEEIGWRSTARHIKDAFNAYHQPNLPTVFD